jgi:hypothetical protein
MIFFFEAMLPFSSMEYFEVVWSEKFIENQPKWPKSILDQDVEASFLEFLEL